MSQTNRIEGILRLTSPLHCASPDKSNLPKFDADGRPLDNGNATATVFQPLVTANSIERIPYFPGNDVRGRLRRKSAKLVLDHICVTEKVTPELYTGLNVGAVDGQPESDLTVEEAIRARDNVYMGLFGGGVRMLRSRYSVCDLVPVLQSTIDAGLVPSKYGERDGQNFTPIYNTKDGDKPIAAFQLFQMQQMLRVNDTMRVLRPDEMVRYIDNAVDAVAKIQQDILLATATRKESKEQAEAGEIRKDAVTKKTDVGNMFSVQSVIAGTPMYFRLDFADDVTDAHVGMILLSLRDLVTEQRLGGWGRSGMGRFDATLTLTRGGETLPVFDTPCASDAAALSAAVGQFVEAAEAEIQALTVPALTMFFTSRESKEDKAAKEAKLVEKKAAAKVAKAAKSAQIAKPNESGAVSEGGAAA